MKLIQSDCLTGMLELPEESVDLVYLDPPLYHNGVIILFV